MSNNVLGILNVEARYVHVEGVDDYRPASAASFLGRYRVLDFNISNMTNSGINSIQVYIKTRPRSHIEHINRTEYNMNTKRGRIQILSGENVVRNELYNTDVANFMANMQYIEESNAAYVVLAPSHFVYAEDFRELVDEHIKSGNDVTVLYQSVNEAKECYVMCDTLDIEDGRVKGINKNRGERKKADISLEAYVIDRALFISLVQEAAATSSMYWFRDILADKVGELKVGTVQHKGFAACINTLKAYYKANLQLRDASALKTLINSSWPIYTMTNDSCPTLYKEGGSVTGSIVGNGCTIEGTVIDSVIGRNVVIKKGAVVRNSVILPNSLINKDVKIENAVIDRYAIVTHVKELKGTEDEPIYVKRRDRI